VPAGGRRQVVINIKVALFQLELTREKMLRHALAAINEYVAEDSLFAASDFPKLVAAEVQNIFVIVRNKVNMYAYHDDIDTLVDMHHHIAQSAMNTPDLRLATLATIQTFHAKVRPRPFARASAAVGARVNTLAAGNEERGGGGGHVRRIRTSLGRELDRARVQPLARGRAAVRVLARDEGQEPHHGGRVGAARRRQGVHLHCAQPRPRSAGVGGAFSCLPQRSSLPCWLCSRR